MNRIIEKLNDTPNRFVVFLKSAAITAIVMAIILALVFGFFLADKNTAAVSGRKGGISVTQLDDKMLNLQLLGEDVSIDIRPIIDFTGKAQHIVDYLPPESKTAMLLGEYIQQKINEFTNICK